METIIVKRLFGLSDPHLRSCALRPHPQPGETSGLLRIEEFETMEPDGTFSSLQISVMTSLTDAMIEGGSILAAFLAVGCVGLIMFYIVNGIYTLSYILIQLLIGDGKSTTTDNKNLIYQLIFDQILLHRLWRRPSSSGSSSSNKMTSRFSYDTSRRPPLPLNNFKISNSILNDKDRMVGLIKSCNKLK